MVSVSAWWWSRPGRKAGRSSPRAAPASRAGPGICALKEVYGTVLFHEGRFRRICKYPQIAPHGSVAALGPVPQARWFAREFADSLLLGDPSVNDAAIAR